MKDSFATKKAALDAKGTAPAGKYTPLTYSWDNVASKFNLEPSPYVKVDLTAQELSFLLFDREKLAEPTAYDDARKLFVNRVFVGGTLSDATAKSGPGEVWAKELGKKLLADAPFWAQLEQEARTSMDFEVSEVGNCRRGCLVDGSSSSDRTHHFHCSHYISHLSHDHAIPIGQTRLFVFSLSTQPGRQWWVCHNHTARKECPKSSIN